MKTTESELADAGALLYWPRILHVRDLARIFAISPRTAAEWLRNGKLGPSIKIGRQRCVLKDSLINYLERLEKGPVQLRPLNREDDD